MFKFSKLFVSIFGIGFFPIAPGTVGSFFSIIFFYIIINSVTILTLLISFLILIFFSIVFINIYSSNKDVYDSSEIIIDEFLGIFTIIIFYEYIKFANDIVMFTLIFLLFRFFDIMKIYPANWVDKNLKNSFGVILDDLIAGVYCILVLSFLNVFL